MELISIPLTTIINQSLSTGIFHDKLKIAKIKLLFKKMIIMYSIIIGLYLWNIYHGALSFHLTVSTLNVHLFYYLICITFHIRGQYASGIFEYLNMASFEYFFVPIT